MADQNQQPPRQSAAQAQPLAAPAIVAPTAPERPHHPVDGRGAPVRPETATPASAPVTGTDTVTVACKWPPGIVLRRFFKTQATQEVMGGGTRVVDVYEPTGEQHVVLGPVVNTGAYRAAGATPEGIFGGYALNPGVPRDLWETWLDQNKTSDLVRNRLVFAAGDYTRAMDEAKDLRDLRSGIEPLDPTKPGDRAPDLRGKVLPSQHAPGARRAA